MCSERPIRPSTESFSVLIGELRRALDGADAVVIGAGSGLSTAAGFDYSGERFYRYFSDFAEKYGIRDMYSGGFYPFESQEEYWAWWSRFILINRYMDPPKPVYDQLLALVRDKDYFVLTTNVDHCFQKTGFDKGRLFYTQGDYGLFQCSQPCSQETYENETVIRQMAERQRDMRVPTELIPRCPRCGRPMMPNLRADERFVEDEGWHAAAARYEQFLQSHRRGRTFYWELGVGFNTPGIIKYPFWRMTAQNGDAVYACLNRSRAAAPEQIAHRSICIGGDIAWALEALGIKVINRN